MKPVPLPTAEYLRESFSYNPTSGILTWRVRPERHFKTLRASRRWNSIYSLSATGHLHKNGYLLTLIGNRSFVTHRIIWKIVTGNEPPQIDHIDHNRMNNVLINLREATPHENQRNRRISRNNLIGLKGVKVSDNKYMARIRLDGKTKYLGVFITPEQAHEAYCKAAKKAYGEFWCPG